MKVFLLAASVTLAAATQSNNWHHSNSHKQDFQWKKPAYPTKKEQNAVIAAFFKQDTCSGPVTVVNTAERACQPLPTNTYHKWWNANQMHKLAYDDSSYSGSSWDDSSSSGSDDSSSGSNGRRLSNNLKGGKKNHNKNKVHVNKYRDLDFAHYNATKVEGYFTVLCNKRTESDYDWHQGWDDSSSSSSSSTNTEDSSSSSSSSSSSHGVKYRTAHGYWQPRPVGGRVLICKDSGCKKCREAVWFQPLQCIAQAHYGWDYLCRGYKKHHTCGFSSIQAVCAARPEEHKKKTKKETNKKDDSSSKSSSDE